ncbi:codanin-1 isoform X2 [Coccinella septempunctata]|uniref:codanin-1 isoform X2 n=1 Tax=Coccinella septempunctata TaxID=41139 RepID=UPI001D05C9CF|nr:codanin-1 isoform X2 [Coccinella septempunctata]
MASILTKKVLSDEINVGDFLKWLEELHIENTKYQELSELCSQKDFVTYFLNSLHELSTRDQSSELPTKSKIRNNSSDNSRINRSLFNGSHAQLNTTINSSHSSQSTLNSTCTTSTPKHNKSLSFDKNYSPIHTNSIQGNTSSNKNYSPIHTNSIQGNTPSNGSSFCLGDFIVKSKKNSSKKKSNKKANTTSDVVDNKTFKKLKPTNLNDSRFNSIDLKSGNSYNFQNNIEEVSRESVNRDFMTREISYSKNKRMDNNVRELSHSRNKRTEDDACELSSEKPGRKINKEKNTNPKNVRYKKEIEKIATIYEFLLKNGLVLSLAGELYFIITLVASKSFCDIECDEDDISYEGVKFDVIFNNSDRITLFASFVLERVFYLLKSLDKNTLRYLCENEGIKTYSPQLIEKLEALTEEKAECNLNLYSSNGKNNICFVLETDNQSNFPSDGSFQGFKKQRDMFYEILRLWESNHMQPHWDFDLSLGKKVRSLVAYHNDSVNFMRLSRLFMEQLLNASSNKGSSSDKNSDLLSSFSNLDKAKIDRLKNRLMKKTTNGINSAPDFCGYQEFFRSFIVSSNNPIFLRHLCNVFISEIVELNGTTFDILDTGSDESETEFDTKKAFVSCLKSLKTLAKFLGYIESMPYKNDNTYSLELMTFQIKIRNQVNPNLNIQKLLEDSICSGSLTLLVPWLCEYLSMLDTVTLRTKYYTEVIHSMINLYRSFVRNDASLPFYNSLLIKFSLGWFFELNNFPQHIFFEKLNDNRSKVQRCIGLDRLSIVDNNILYIFCPFLEEFRKLVANETTVKDRITSRHITPLSKVESAKESIKKKIEVQLEETFFNGHPSSLKKTVDFVAERVASTCVKHLCYTVVPEYKKDFIGQLKTKLNECFLESRTNEAELQSRGTRLAEENMSVLRTLCDKEVNKIIESRIRTSIIALLPMDYLPQMQNICVSAGERMCQEKVQQWASTHIVIGLLMKEVRAEIRNLVESANNIGKTKPSYALPPSGNDIIHDQSAETGPHTLNEIRYITACLLTNPKGIPKEKVIEILSDVHKTVTARCDLNEMVIVMLCSQLIDLMMLMVSCQPSTFLATKEYFLKIWKLNVDKSNELFEGLISLKNFKVIKKYGKVEESLSVKAKICVDLIMENLITCQYFEYQCMGLFKNELDGDILKVVTLFFKKFVDAYKERSKSSEFTYLLEFLSDYCIDL